MKSVAFALMAALAGVGLLAPLPVRAQETLSPAVLQCQRDRADPAPCWSEFLAGPAPAQHKALLVALSFSTSYRPAPSAQSAKFFQALLLAADQERATAEPATGASCMSPGCTTEDAFYTRAMRDAWAFVNSVATDASSSERTDSDRLGGDAR